MIATYIVMEPSGVDDQHNVILSETERQGATRVKDAARDQPAVTWCPYCDTSNQETFTKCGGCDRSIEYTYEEGDPQYEGHQELARNYEREQATEEKKNSVIAADLSINDIETLIPSWDLEKLLAMQNQEQNGRNRKGALGLLNNAVVDAGSTEDDDD